MFNNAKLERCWKPLELCTACDTLVILVDKQINELIKKSLQTIQGCSMKIQCTLRWGVHLCSETKVFKALSVSK